VSLVPSPSQTVGPFFNFALTPDGRAGVMAREAVEGRRIRLALRVVDGDGAPTPGDSLIELWQADARGRYPHPRDPLAGECDPRFAGFGRLETDADGRCVFETVRPGPVPDGGGGVQAPHINVSLFARGLQKRLCTRVYFEGDPANAHDPVLQLVPESRRATLMACRVADQPETWALTIRLRGDGETVFFDV
jgi:protocatechuate 3,4-dioxygenase alpha subunit